MTGKMKTQFFLLDGLNHPEKPAFLIIRTHRTISARKQVKVTDVGMLISFSVMNLHVLV